jgi:EAL domain-containing protein (putative c-di-GMP-specific phosphodiesterase class I)
LIVPIGEWVLRSACVQAVAWQRSGFSSLRVSVNLSPRQFGDPRLLEKVKAVLEATDLCPRYLDLEITESLLMHGEGETVRALKAFKQMGVRLSIDDFGTGYSSLDYLRHFPVDILKIDRSFIQDLETDASAAAITRAVVALGHSLHLVVVAEGVTSEAQLDFLRALGCDAAQGFLFGRPVPADEFEKLLAEHGQRDGAEG